LVGIDAAGDALIWVGTGLIGIDVWFGCEMLAVIMKKQKEEVSRWFI